MKTPRKPWAEHLVVGADLCAVALLWSAALSAWVNPVYWRWGDVWGLAFPLFLVGVLLMTVITLIVCRRKVWIPLVGLLATAFSVRAYCPINFPSAPPKEALKVLTYNVGGFWNGGENVGGPASFVPFIRQEAPDIVCLQEAYCADEILQKELITPLHDLLPHEGRVSFGENQLLCLSRYPIVDTLTLSHHVSNGSIVFVVVPPSGDTLRVVNCHLQSTSLSGADRQGFQGIVHGDRLDKSQSRRLVARLAQAAVLRSHQVALTAKYLRRHAGQRLIVCGDFNDSPISYTRHALMQTGLADAYADSGNGIGRSFNRNAICVRIDHLLYSNHWKAYGATVVDSVKLSDHYPLIAYLAPVERR